MPINARIGACLLLLVYPFQALPCSMGGPSYAIPLNSPYADVRYQNVGGNLQSYLAKQLKTGHWRFVENDEVELIVPEYTDEVASAHVRIPAVCKKPNKTCNRIRMFVISSVPIARQFNGIKEQKDQVNPKYIAIINDVDTSLITGFRYIGTFSISEVVKEVTQRFRLTERENAVYAVIDISDKQGSQTTHLVVGKRIYTSINTCGARYWSQGEKAGALFNNAQWQQWNNYYYEDYDEYVQVLGEWMEPYRLKNPVKYAE